MKSAYTFPTSGGGLFGVASSGHSYGTFAVLLFIPPTVLSISSIPDRAGGGTLFTSGGGGVLSGNTRLFVRRELSHVFVTNILRHSCIMF